MQLPIQTGVKVKDGAFRTSYPLNLRHKLVESGVSKGQLVATDGARTLATGPGADRGGIVWEGVHYRVMSSALVSVAQNGTTTTLGTLPDDGLLCRFAYSFDKLAINASGRLFYWDGSTVTEVTDTDLGLVLDVRWIDGYFVTTDGDSVIVTELNDPTSIDPLKYGSSETDPDPIVGIEPLREELAVINRYSIQFQQNAGTSGYPFANVRGAMIPYGAISAQAKCKVAGSLAFVGGAKDEPLGVYLVVQGAAIRLSDEEIDDMLADCSDPTDISLEARAFGTEEQLVVHAGDQSAALVLRASQQADTSLWHILGTDGGRYTPRNAVHAYDAQYVCDGATIGVLDPNVTAHFGTEPGWEFDAGLLYPEGRSMIVQEIEITGQFPVAGGAVFFSMTRDGETWSREVSRRLTGFRTEHVIWRPNTRVGRMCGLKFRGHGKVAVSRGDVRAEPLAA